MDAWFLFCFSPTLYVILLSFRGNSWFAKLLQLACHLCSFSLKLELEVIEEEQDDEKVGFYIVVLYDQQSLYISWKRNR
jgi:hypothetical protein